MDPPQWMINAYLRHSVPAPRAALVDKYGDSHVWCLTCNDHVPWSMCINPHTECPSCYNARLRACAETHGNFRYFLTFTTKPGADRDQVWDNVLQLAKRQSTLGIVKMTAVREHWDTNAHVHVYIETTKKLARSRIAYYEKDGHIDKRTAKGTEADAHYYMSKEGPIETLVDLSNSDSTSR